MDEKIQILIDSILARVTKAEDDISQLFKRTNDSSNWQAKYGEKIETIEKNITKLTALVEGLVNAPAKKWDSTVMIIITAIVTGAIAFFMGKLTGR